jgi:hypothetical protein
VLISSAIVFWGQLNSFFKSEVLSGPNNTAVNQKPEIDKVEPYVIERVSTPPKEKDIRTAEDQTETKSEAKEPIKEEKSPNKKSKLPNNNNSDHSSNKPSAKQQQPSARVVTTTGTTPAATDTTPAATGTTPAATSNNSSDKNTKNWPRVPPIVEERSSPSSSLPK